MLSNALGVKDGVSRMGRVTMYSPVAWISIISFMWVRDVVAHGAGYAARNTVILIITLRRAKSFLLRRIIMAIVVRQRQDSSKKTTVLEGIILIVLSVGDL
jgi:hypothetical protein